MNQFTINIKADNGKAEVEFLLNGEKLPELFAVNFIADMRNGDFQLLGKRLAKNIENKYFVDEETKETAIEQVNLLEYLIDGNVIDKIEQTTKELNNALQDIKDTSTLRARNLIEERVGVLNEPN